MKIIPIGVIAPVIAIILFDSGCTNTTTSDRADLRIQLNEPYASDLTWNEITIIAEPFEAIGISSFWINDFLWDNHFIDGPTKYLEPDILSFHQSDFNDSMSDINQWCDRHQKELVYISIGRSVEFEVVRDTVDLFRRHGLIVELDTYQNDPNTIYVDRYWSKNNAIEE